MSILFVSGCGTIQKMDEALEGVDATSVKYTRKTYGTSATIIADGYYNNSEEVKADKIFIDESIPIVGSVTIDIQGYKRVKNKPKSADEDKK